MWQPALRDSQEVHMIGGLPRLQTVGVEGPYNVTGVSATPSRERIFVCQPGRPPPRSSPCADQDPHQPGAARLPASGHGGGRARRRWRSTSRRARAAATSTPASAPASRGSWPARRSCTGSSAIPPACGAGAAHPVSDVELASRLSFFLWSSIPDETLLNLATAGRLREPGVLAAQVRRMIADERADALVSNFAGQWLQLRNLESKVAPDLLMFPDFDDNIRKAFRRETELFFGHILRENRSALELLSADYTFVNERLARHYGIPGVYGARFRQVKLTDPNRRGLLGHGSILSLTSVATRTSPVFRGKYILSTFLNTPPPPPPPNVPTLEESNKDAAAAPKTVREQLEAAPEQPGLRVLPSHHRPAGLRARELQLSRAVARGRPPMARRSTPPACWRTVPRWMAPPRCATPS